jgi:integrase
MSGRRLAPRTIDLYNDLQKRIIEPTFGKAPIGKITPESVRRWHKTSSESTPIQAAKAYRLLRAMLNTAASDGLIAKNPCRIPGAGQEDSAERPLVTPDVVLTIAENIEPHLRALVVLAAFGGLRLGELLSLRRRHLDLEAGTVLVEQQAVRLRDGTQLTTAPKTRAGRRTVHLPALVVVELRAHLAQWGEPGPDGHVFVGVRGGPLSPSSLQPAFNRARKKAGAPKATLHDLRHSAGTLAAWTGATTRELMARLGHASPRAAMRYQHAAEARDRDIAERLDVLLAATARNDAAVIPLARDGRAMEPGPSTAGEAS